MNSPSFNPAHRVRSAASVLAALALVMACGGGGGGGADTASAFTQGTITGFGSIIVNGVRFDDRRAQVLDDDDRARSSADLKLGMTVEILSGRVRSGSSGSSGSADASQIRFGSELVGSVSAVDTTGKTLTVLDQTVEVTDTTVFDDGLAGGLAAVKVDDIVEVHALFDGTTGHYTAKRIELEPGATAFKLRGIVSGLQTGSKTFMIGAATINYAGVADADLPNNLADGVKVRVRLQTTKVNNEWVATSVRTGKRMVDDHDEAKVRGMITAFTDIGHFVVNDIPVVTDANTRFEDGTSGVVAGAMVEVEGAIVNGVLLASKVELEDEHADDDSHGNELHGAISALDTGARTFVVRGVAVHYSDTTVFSRGAAGDLADGKEVEVRGVLSADGTTVEARVIKFES